MPELRQNIITGDWVVIAPERAKRPQDFVIPESVKVIKKEDCPFCEGSAGYKENKKIHRASTPHTYTIPNKYPAFVGQEKGVQIRSYYPEKNFYRARPAFGDHEVVVLKDHELSLPTMPKHIATDMFEVIQHRCQVMSKEEGIVSVMAIYNHGAEAGASICHPHAQIFSSGIVANTVGKELDGSEKYYGINGKCIYCDIIEHELKEKSRVVYENEDFLAATAYAARFPMETWIYPKKHMSSFEETPKSKIKNLADATIEVVSRINKLVPRAPLNFYIHSLPLTFEGSSAYHWHLEIAPKLTNYGGFELGSGVIIDIMSPEEAAEYMRNKK